MEDNLDRRTKRQKLEAMARQSVSPLEAEIAQKKLEVMEPDPQIDNPFEGYRFYQAQPSGYATSVYYRTVSFTMSGNFYDIFGQKSSTFTVGTKK